MKLVMENLTGSIFDVEVEDNATVLDLKRRIGEEQNLPSERLILIAADDRDRIIYQEDDELPLADCGVKDESHVYIFFYPLPDDDDDPDSYARRCFYECPDILHAFSGTSLWL